VFLSRHVAPAEKSFGSTTLWKDGVGEAVHGVVGEDGATALSSRRAGVFVVGGREPGKGCADGTA
jgi:hypothetical protein